MKTRLLSGALVVVCIVPITVFAGSVVRVDDAVTVGITESVDGNWYSAGGTITVSGTIKGDAYIAAGTAEIKAPIKEDLVLLTGTARVAGDVGDDVRIVSGDVSVSGGVGGDLVVFGGTVYITDTAVIAGDVLLYGGSVVIDGIVKGELVGQADSVVLNGRVEGPVRFTHVGVLILGKSADIRNSLTYTSAKELEKNESARIAQTPSYTKSALPEIDARQLIVDGIALLLFALLFQWVFHKKLNAIVPRARSKIGTSILVGVGGIIATPILAFLFMISGIGAPIGLILLILYSAYLAAAVAFTVILVGAYTERLHTHALIATKRSTFIGAIMITIFVYFLPLFFFVVAITLPLGVLMLETHTALFGKKK